MYGSLTSRRHVVRIIVHAKFSDFSRATLKNMGRPGYEATTALTAAENEWKWVKGHKRIGFIQLIRKTFQQLSVFSLFVCIKCCKYSLLFALFGVVPPNS